MRYWLLAIALLLSAALHLTAQVNLSLNLNVPPGPHESGEAFDIILQYSCASTVSGARNARIEVPLGNYINFRKTLGTSHIASSGYDAATQTAWYEFVDPLPSGASGELSISVNFEGGSTPHGYSTNFAGTFTADNASTVTDSAPASAKSAMNVDIDKSVINAAEIDGNTFYEIEVCNAQAPMSPKGQQTLFSATITDQLPTGSEFVSFGNKYQGIATYDISTHQATWTVGDMKPGECAFVSLILKYPSANFSVGTTVTNTATATGTTPGGNSATFSDSESSVLSSATSYVDLTKTVDYPTRQAGGSDNYDIHIQSNGTLPLDNLQFVDTIPQGLIVYRVVAGQYNDQGSSATNYVTLEYQTTNNSSWRTLSSNRNQYDYSAFEFDYEDPDRITILRWSFGNRSSAFASYEPAEILYKVDTNMPAGKTRNCAYSQSTSPNFISKRTCATQDITARLPGSSQFTELLFDNCNNYFDLADTVALKGRVNALNFAARGIEDIVVYWLIPKTLTYVPNSLVLTRSLSPTPIIAYNTNFNSTYNLLSARYAGSFSTLEPDKQLDYKFKTVVNELMSAGYGSARVHTFVKGSNPYSDAFPTRADFADVDGNGDSSEMLCASEIRLDINAKAALSAELGVLGSNDANYTSFPNVGSTLPGGLADYRLKIQNVGNVPLTDFLVVDILPHVGDGGVVDVAARDSRWRPLLIGAVEAPPGITVSYSTQGNPCRAADGFLDNDSSSCQPANWSIVPPADITTVKSLRFDFGSLVVGPADTLSFKWPMRTPTDIFDGPGVSPGDIAWNSFGYIATNAISNNVLLPSEPTKSGLAVGSIQPGVLGDRVWKDTNDDGVQNTGEPGLNGVRVELYEDNGDGVPDCTTDTQVAFTVTTGDGNYLFSKLAAGNYFLLIEKPATSNFSPLGAGTSATDNDFSEVSCRGWGVGVSPIIAVTTTDFLYGYDAGLVPSGQAAIGDYVWLDANANGLQDEGANAGLNSVLVQLLNSSNSVVDEQRTRDGINGLPGKYQFTNVVPGNYRVRLQAGAASNYGPKNAGGDTHADSDFDPTNGTTALINLAANQTNSSVDAALQSAPFEICGNGIDDDGDGNIDCPRITGFVFEDINYGGGNGRTFGEANTSATASGWANNEIATGAARVELYSTSGDFITSQVTGANGAYAFDNLEVGDYYVRVATSSVVSNRGLNSGSTTPLAVMSYRGYESTHLRNEVGGRSHRLVDAPANTSNQTWASLFTSAQSPHAYTDLSVGSDDIDNVNFGFNFNTIVNNNNTGQGSLRQFILNANALNNNKLDQEDAPSGRNNLKKPLAWDVSIFELKTGDEHAFSITSELPAIDDAQTHLTGYTQLSSTLGFFITRRIRIELIGDGGNFDALWADANSISVSGLSITGFDRGISATANTSDLFVWGNYIGVRADGTTAGTNFNHGIYAQNQTNAFLGTNGDGINDNFEGNVVSNSYEGISIRNSSGILIAGNRVGTDHLGIVDHGNRYHGVYLRDCSVRNVVGYDDRILSLTPVNARNLLSGNGTDGVRIIESNDQMVAGNFIGTNANGRGMLGNTGYGVQVSVGTTNLIVGTDSDGNGDLSERNVISGNGTGLRLNTNHTMSDVRIAGNYFGVDVTGNAALPNLTHGMDLNSRIIGATIGTNGDGIRDQIEGNVISGNAEDGIRLTSGEGITIAGNKIGVGADGTTVLGNGKRGIFIAGDASLTTIGYNPTMTNNDAAVVGNTIRNNGDCGIGYNLGVNNVLIRRNNYGSNDGIAIDLAYNEVSGNDNGDNDSGPNGLLNYPVLTRVQKVGTSLQVEGFTRPSTLVELYIADGQANPSPLPPAYATSFGEGATYLASAIEGSSQDSDATSGTYADNGTGTGGTYSEARFSFLIPVSQLQAPLLPGFEITATAVHEADRATSEFSPTVILNFVEDCTNGLDDDGDGDIDCADANCPGAAPASRVTQVPGS